MAFVLPNMTRQRASTSGIADFGFGDIPTGYRGLDAISVGDTTIYSARAGEQWEVGTGTRQASVFERTTVLDSSNGGSKIDFTAEPMVIVTVDSTRLLAVPRGGNDGDLLVKSAGDDWQHQHAPFGDTLHSQRGGGDLHALASAGAHGFMASSDKSKLDGIEPGATAGTDWGEIGGSIENQSDLQAALDSKLESVPDPGYLQVRHGEELINVGDSAALFPFVGTGTFLIYSNGIVRDGTTNRWLASTPEYSGLYLVNLTVRVDNVTDGVSVILHNHTGSAVARIDQISPTTSDVISLSAIVLITTDISVGASVLIGGGISMGATFDVPGGTDVIGTAMSMLRIANDPSP